MRPNDKKAEGLIDTPMPTNVKQLRGLLRGLGHYRKFLPNLSMKLMPVTALLKQGEKFSFSGDMEVTVRGLLAQLTEPPTFVCPDWDAVEDGIARFTCASTPALMGLGLRRSKRSIASSAR